MDELPPALAGSAADGDLMDISCDSDDSDDEDEMSVKEMSTISGHKRKRHDEIEPSKLNPDSQEKWEFSHEWHQYAMAVVAARLRVKFRSEIDAFLTGCAPDSFVHIKIQWIKLGSAYNSEMLNSKIDVVEEIIDSELADPTTKIDTPVLTTSGNSFSVLCDSWKRKGDPVQMSQFVRVLTANIADTSSFVKMCVFEFPQQYRPVPLEDRTKYESTDGTHDESELALEILKLTAAEHAHCDHLPSSEGASKCGCLAQWDALLAILHKQQGVMFTVLL
jgi:hypothetical protein